MALIFQVYLYVFPLVLHSGRHTLKWPQTPIPLYNPLPLRVGCTCDLLITPRIWWRWRDVTPLIWLFYQTLSQWERDWFSHWPLKKQAALIWTVCGQGHVAGDYYRLHGGAGDLSPTNTRIGSLPTIIRVWQMIPSPRWDPRLPPILWFQSMRGPS